MIEQYRVIFGDKSKIYVEEIIEKKSKFIAHIRTVETEVEAIAFINEIKKKHYNANHNCSAFVIGTRKELTRCNDDGEPSGTAGKPILDVLMGSGLVNVACVVTRYFGGIKLGKSGIGRAYSDAAKTGVDTLPIAEMCLGKKVNIHTDYNTIGKILYELTQREISQDNSVYTDVVCITVTVPITEYVDFKNSIIEISSGKSTVEDIEEVYFPIVLK